LADKQGKPIIAIDVDQTVVEMHSHWTKWCQNNLGVTPDYSKAITDERMLEFWNQEDLYNDKRPIKDTVKYISELHKHFHIFFVSHCTPKHFKSKIEFILKYFQFDGFIDMYEKHRIHFDYIIDDRDIFFKEVKDAECILYKDNWKEIFEYLMSRVDNKDKIKNISI